VEGSSAGAELAVSVTRLRRLNSLERQMRREQTTSMVCHTQLTCKTVEKEDLLFHFYDNIDLHEITVWAKIEHLRLMQQHKGVVWPNAAEDAKWQPYHAERFTN